MDNPFSQWIKGATVPAVFIVPVLTFRHLRELPGPPSLNPPERDAAAGPVSANPEPRAAKGSDTSPHLLVGTWPGWAPCQSENPPLRNVETKWSDVLFSVEGTVSKKWWSSSCEAGREGQGLWKSRFKCLTRSFTKSGAVRPHYWSKNPTRAPQLIIIQSI